MPTCTPTRIVFANEQSILLNKSFEHEFEKLLKRFSISKSALVTLHYEKEGLIIRVSCQNVRSRR